MFLQQPRPESVRPKGPAGSGAGEPPLSAFAGARAEAAGVGCGTEPRTLRPMWQSQRLVPRSMRGMRRLVMAQRGVLWHVA